MSPREGAYVAVSGTGRREPDPHAARREEKRRKARYGMRISGRGARLLDRLLRRKGKRGPRP